MGEVKIIPNADLTIKNGGIVPLGSYKNLDKITFCHRRSQDGRKQHMAQNRKVGPVYICTIQY